MLTRHTIERHLKARQNDRLLDALIDNGFPAPLPLRVRLAQSALTTPALALRRLSEISYDLAPSMERLVSGLIESQQPDGSFDHDPLATAAAAAALARIEEDHPHADPSLPTARRSAVAALARMQAQDGLFNHPDDRCDDDRARVAALVLYLLAGDEAFQSAARLSDLHSALEQRRSRMDPATHELWQMASLVARTPSRTAGQALDRPTSRPSPAPLAA